MNEEFILKAQGLEKNHASYLLREDYPKLASLNSSIEYLQADFNERRLESGSLR